MDPLRTVWISALVALAGASSAAPPPCGARGSPSAPAGEPRAAGDVPSPVLDAALAALAARLTAAGVTAVPVLVEAEAVTWPDGSLGCGAPRAATRPALVPGYRLVFAAGGTRYEYHASEAALVVACDRRRRPRAELPRREPPVPH